ncbi:MAG: transposase [Cyanobacteriota bacterium]|nr:transposase [Cyanobacteriota bacterium]
MNFQLFAIWVAAGNLREDFEEKSPKIVMILDNTSFHKKAEYLQKIEKEMPKIHLEYLPEYSPDYNLDVLSYPNKNGEGAGHHLKAVDFDNDGNDSRLYTSFVCTEP